ncbi:MAG: hypothetical protein O7G85_08170, partial [Planctomycetota bacterium]|nr:hypothetical protein [Planctomycetota bacterium]
MHTVRLLIFFITFLALTWTGLVMAHPDDPKGLVKRVPYRGPGYRSTAPKFTAKYGASQERAMVDFPASGIRLQTWLPLSEFGTATAGNDCWGYVSPTNREYAILGVNTGTGFVDITDPGNPTVLQVISGPVSIW